MSRHYFSLFRHWIETHFNTVLILSFVLGMLSPWAESVPNSVVFLSLVGMIYFFPVP
jgi:hypothetical protein